MTSRGATSARRPTAWSARDRLGIVALLLASLTGAAAIAAGGSETQVLGACAHVVAAAAALFVPTALVAQVLIGQILAGSLVLGPAQASLPLVLLVIAGVVATAELVALTVRLHPSARRDPIADLRRAAFSTFLAGAVFVFVTVARVLPGPTGFGAIVLASAACIALAVMLVRDGDDE